MGFLVIPWILIIGLTGFYLSHSKLVKSDLPSSSCDEKQFDEWPNRMPGDERAAKVVAEGISPSANFRFSCDDEYHGHDVFMNKSNLGSVIVVEETGHYWVKITFVRQTFDPGGRQIDRKFCWATLFKQLHTTGWIDSTLRYLAC